VKNITCTLPDVGAPLAHLKEKVWSLVVIFCGSCQIFEVCFSVVSQSAPLCAFHIK